MNYKSFLFRDLDNNYVLARRNPETREISLDIVANGFVPADQLPLNQVEVVAVTENQEDVMDVKRVTRFEIVDETTNQPIDLAEMYDTDEDKFWSNIDRLWDLVQLRCSMMTTS